MADPQDVFERYISGVLPLEEILADEELYVALRKAITGDTLPETMHAAETFAGRLPETLPKGFAKPELDIIGRTVAEGLARGEHPFRTARFLDVVTELDDGRKASLRNFEAALRKKHPDWTEDHIRASVERRKNVLLNQRKRTIARTEMGNAQEHGRREWAERAGKTAKSWITAGDGRVDPDECAPNEAEGWILIDRAFGSGHQAPLAHTGCRCSLAYRKNPPNAAADRRAQARADATAMAIEGV